MAITVKDLFERMMTTDLSAKVFEIEDAVDALSNEKVEVVEVNTFSRYTRVDANAATEITAAGDLASGSIASYSSGVWTSNEYNMGRPIRKGITIGEDKFHVFGITPDMLDTSYKMIDEAELSNIYNKLSVEAIKLYQDFKEERRKQVTTFLDEMGASSDQAVLPLGLQVAANSRVGFWNFDNLLSAALSTTEFDNAINGIAVQFDERGNGTGPQQIRYLFHESNFMLAQKILNPNDVLNANYRSAADFKVGGLPNGVKFAGNYGTSGSDWVVIGTKHKIKRLVMKGYEKPKVRIVWDNINNKIYIICSDWTGIVCDSPNGIVKSTVS